MICKTEWCDNDAKFLGYCSKHYQQYRKYGYVRRMRSDKNEIIIYEDFAEIIMYDKKYNQLEDRCIIDVEDVERVKFYKWSLRNDGYAYAKINGKGIKLHRFLFDNIPDGMFVDHINRIKLDNRKNNLRLVTPSENNQNLDMYKTNKSGRTGIYKRNNTWIVTIRYNNKHKHIGCFKNFDDAVKAREQAEIECYGFIKY